VKLQQDLREFVELFLSRGVEFVVVGGHAVAFHGYPRMTDDIDILVRPSRENGQRIIGALEAFGFGDIGLTAESFTAPSCLRLAVRPLSPQRSRRQNARRACGPLVTEYRSGSGPMSSLMVTFIQNETSLGATTCTPTIGRRKPLCSGAYWYCRGRFCGGRSTSTIDNLEALCARDGRVLAVLER
jgi:hypothetical protein